MLARRPGGSAISLGGVQVKHKDGTSATFLPSADTDAARAGALTLAVAAATAYSEIDIGPGVYDYAAGSLPQFPDNVTVTGAGRQSTTLHCSALGSGGIGIGNHSTVRRLSISNDSGDGCNQTTQVGALLEDVDITVGATGVHVFHGGAGTTEVRGARFYSSSEYLYSCACVTDGGTLTLVDCLWLAANAPSQGEIKCSGGTVKVIRGAILSAATTHATQALTGSLYISGLDCDPAKLVGTITLGTLAANVSGSSSGGGGGGGPIDIVSPDDTTIPAILQRYSSSAAGAHILDCRDELGGSLTHVDHAGHIYTPLFKFWPNAGSGTAAEIFTNAGSGLIINSANGFQVSAGAHGFTVGQGFAAYVSRLSFSYGTSNGFLDVNGADSTFSLTGTADITCGAKSAAAGNVAWFAQRFSSGSTADTCQARDQSGAVMWAIGPNGEMKPPTLAAATAQNKSMYIDSTTGVLMFKDGAGTPHALY